MQKVSKWGNSLGVRIPSRMAESMDLKQGDSVRLVPLGTASIGIAPVEPLSKSEALERLGRLRWKLPADYKFNRDEANSRHHD